ncbi:hypothetical protein [Campylobacter troglodytis]|nr:hypothetical protein [Campylobacter troglodytis]
MKDRLLSLRTYFKIVFSFNPWLNLTMFKLLRDFFSFNAFDSACLNL